MSPPYALPHTPCSMIPVLFYFFLFFTVVLFRSRKYRVDVDRKKNSESRAIDPCTRGDPYDLRRKKK